MQYWLMKSEPDVFSIDTLAQKKLAGWDGVRNYQARNFMRDSMKLGDLVFFYHSNAEPSGIAGIAKVSKPAHPDPTQFDKKSEYFDPKATKEKPIWFQVEVSFVRKFSRFVSLMEIKEKKELSQMMLLKRSRLSITPITEKEWKFIEAMEHEVK